MLIFRCRFNSFPIWRDLYHFDSVMNISFNDGKKHEDLSKVVCSFCDDLKYGLKFIQQLIYVAHNVFNHDDYPTDYLLLRLIWAYVDLDMYLSFDLHTERTIAAGRQQFNKFAELLKVSKSHFLHKCFL